VTREEQDRPPAAPKSTAGASGAAAAARRGPASGPPPLRPFGLVLLHDGSWRHEGQPILNRKLRAHFDRSVAYLPEEGKYVVRLGHFRGEIEVEEAAFFVREIDFARGELVLSDGTRDTLDPDGIGESPIDGALLCRVKRGLAPGGLRARFTHAAQAELLGAVQERAGTLGVELGGRWVALPPLA
jgi:hypothetical protein